MDETQPTKPDNFDDETPTREVPIYTIRAEIYGAPDGEALPTCERPTVRMRGLRAMSQTEYSIVNPGNK